MSSQLDIAISQIKEANLGRWVEDDLRRQILEFCHEHDDALYRTCVEGHLTGSAVVVDTARRATLLVHHVKLNRWLQPGGHADGHGDLAQVALKEATEETGMAGLEVVTPAISVDIHDIPTRGAEVRHLHLDVRFLVLAPTGADVSPDPTETNGAEWFTAESAEVQGSPELKALVERALAVSDFSKGQS